MDKEMEGKNVFQDLKVVDFSWAIVGPLITKYLADFGATVVRVESMKNPCVQRATGPYKGGKVDVDKAGYFAIFNANKYSISLNFKHPEGNRIARRLAAWADVVVENFRPGVMERWGLGYEQVKQFNPEVVYLSSSTLGQTGPHRQYGGAGFLLVALGGFANYVGYPGDVPMRLPQAYTDFVTYRFGAAALVAALTSRQRTGCGTYIDLSQLESGLQFLLPAIMDYTVNQTESSRQGNLSSFAVPHNVYRCQGMDRWIAIAVFSDKEWALLCEVMGKPALAEDPRFATFEERKKHEAEVDAEVEAWTRNQSAEELMPWLQSRGIAAGIVQNAEDIDKNPQLNWRKYFWKMEHPKLGKFPFLGLPFKFSKTPPEGRMPAPCLGEHTEYVCTKLLGMSDEEFLAGMNDGVFE